MNLNSVYIFYKCFRRYCPPAGTNNGLSLLCYYSEDCFDGSEMLFNSSICVCDGPLEVNCL